jgi:hypothetical protein
MNINDFNYRETPTKKTRQFEVHPLSVEGFNQYLNKDSYTHNFLKSPNALYTKENMNELAYNNLYHENFLSSKNRNEDNEKLYNKKKDFFLSNRETLRKYYPRSQSQSHKYDKNYNNYNNNYNYNNNSRDQSKVIDEEKEKENQKYKYQSQSQYQYQQLENILGGNFTQKQKIEKNKEQKNENVNVNENENEKEKEKEKENNLLINYKKNKNQNQLQNNLLNQSQNQNQNHSLIQGKEKHINDFLEKEKTNINFETKKKSNLTILDPSPLRSHDSFKKFKPFLHTNKNFYIKGEKEGQGGLRSTIKNINIGNTTFYNKDKYKENYYDSLKSLKGNLFFEGNYLTNRNKTNNNNNNNNLINSVNGNFK